MTRIENKQPVYGFLRGDAEVKEYLADQLYKMYEESKSRRQIKCPRCGAAIETRLDPRPGAVRSRQFSCPKCNYSGIYVVRDGATGQPL
jgi:ribosomal protein S27AE